MTSFTILGFAWFFGELQEPDKPLTVTNWIIMLAAALAVGMGQKRFDFSMIALLFFMPKNQVQFSKDVPYLPPFSFADDVCGFC